jgi:hypothetical protein
MLVADKLVFFVISVPMDFQSVSIEVFWAVFGVNKNE